MTAGPIETPQESAEIVDRNLAAMGSAGLTRPAPRRCYCGQPAVAMHAGPDPHKAMDKPRPICAGCAGNAIINRGYGLLCDVTCLYPVRKAGEDPKTCGLEWPCPEHTEPATEGAR